MRSRSRWKQPIAEFGEAVLNDLMQAEWEPGWEWQEQTLKKAQDIGLVRLRPVTPHDDVSDEYDFVLERVHRSVDKTDAKAGMSAEPGSPTTDTERMDWLERNLMHLSHHRATNSVDMSGRCVIGQLVNEARGSKGGPSYFRVNHRSVREAIDAAMQSPNAPRSATPNPKGNHGS